MSHLLLRVGDLSVRAHRRVLLSVTGTLVLAAVVAVGALTLGDYDVSPVEVVQAFLGRLADPLATYFVTDVRAPRVVAALTVGAALGAAGAMFQSVTQNPLGSPDIIGFTTGAATGALVQIIVVGADTGGVAAGALVGGLGTAAVVFGLTRRHGLSGQRLVLVGLGVGAALQALSTLLVVRASLVAAQTAAQWLAGSLNAVLWPRATGTLVVVALLLAACVPLARPLSMLSLGDDVCRSAGIDVGRVRTWSVVLAVALVSVATAATGPLAFVALAAPQVARRLARSPAAGLAGSALTGALLVVASDVVAQRLLAPDEMAVGVITGAVGGVYLLGLLTHEWKKARR